MLELDGSDGGGQLVRTALTLSVLDSRPVRMEQIRANRPNPGLKQQHLACVELLADLGDAEVSGTTVGSDSLTFEPNPGAAPAFATAAPAESGAAEPIEVGVDVGTAGSVTLIADTLFPLATRLSRPIRATLTGGTDVMWSPSADYLAHVKLPVLRALGIDVAVDVPRRGFYPAGGGELVVTIAPSTPAEIDLSDPRHGSRHWRAHAVASESLVEASVADRLAETATATLADREIDSAPSASVSYVESRSPGAVLTLVAEPAAGGPVTALGSAPAGFVAYGERGVRSEEVATQAVDAAAAWLDTDAPVDPHLGDQLVVWLALAGGSVRIPRLTDHVRTSVDLVQAFGYDVSLTGESAGSEATLVGRAIR